MSSLPTGSQGPCAICGSPVTANQLSTYPPKLTRSVALVPLLDPTTVTSPTASTTDSEDTGVPMKGVQMKSKLKTLLADLAKVRKDHDGAKVFPRFHSLNTPLNSTLFLSLPRRHKSVPIRCPVNEIDLENI